MIIYIYIYHHSSIPLLCGLRASPEKGVALTRTPGSHSDLPRSGFLQYSETSPPEDFCWPRSRPDCATAPDVGTYTASSNIPISIDATQTIYVLTKLLTTHPSTWFLTSVGRENAPS